MTKSTEERKQKRRVTRLSEVKDAKRKEKRNPEDPWQWDHWFELLEYFDPHKIMPLKVPDVEHKRMFVMGTCADLVILQMSQFVSREQAAEAVKALAAKGIRAMAIGDSVRFMRLRMCVPAEEELLNSADTAKLGLIHITWPTPIPIPQPEPEPVPDSNVLLASERFAKDKTDENDPEH